MTRLETIGKELEASDMDFDGISKKYNLSLKTTKDYYTKFCKKYKNTVSTPIADTISTPEVQETSETLETPEVPKTLSIPKATKTVAQSTDITEIISKLTQRINVLEANNTKLKKKIQDVKAQNIASMYTLINNIQVINEALDEFCCCFMDRHVYVESNYIKYNEEQKRGLNNIRAYYRYNKERIDNFIEKIEIRLLEV